MSECAYLANANSLNKDHVVTTDLEHKRNYRNYIVYLFLSRGAEHTLFVLYGPCWA